MGGGESTNSSQSTNRPLTAAERQDLYRSSIGNILNTYTESGLPYGGQGSMNSQPNSTPATYNPSQTIPMSNNGGTWSSSLPTGTNAQPTYNASGNASTYSKGGDVTWDPKTYFQAPDPSTNMPTGAADPGGVNFPTYQTAAYQAPGTYNSAAYVDPGTAKTAAYTDPGAAKTLTGGDYNALQDSLTKGYTAPLDAAKTTDIRNYNDSAAKRGVWSSGLALQGENDINKAYAPQYESAGAQATNKRYDLQSGENQNLNQYGLSTALMENASNQSNAASQNQYGLSSAQMANSANQTNAANQNQYSLSAANAANTYNQSNAQNQFSAGWAPLNYLSSLWQGTGGQVGGSSTFGQSLNLSV